MSLHNQPPNEKLIADEVVKLAKRLHSKGIRCVIMISATDGKNGATVGGGGWVYEIERALLMKESLERLGAEYLSTMAQLSLHHHGEWFRARPAVARKVADSVCWRACAARGMQLQQVSVGPGDGKIVRKGPPASLRLLDGMRDQIANPNDPVLYEHRRALDRTRRSRARQAEEAPPAPSPLIED